MNESISLAPFLVGIVIVIAILPLQLALSLHCHDLIWDLSRYRYVTGALLVVSLLLTVLVVFVTRCNASMYCVTNIRVLCLHVMWLAECTLRSSGEGGHSDDAGRN